MGILDFTYNPSAVALSIAVAILGSFTGLVMTTGIRRTSGHVKTLRIFLGGLGVGGGIWSMHFISMLAVILPIDLYYDVTQTTMSAIIAVAFVAVALAIVTDNKLGNATLPVSAIFLGSGIGGMHYLGMYAIRGNCGVSYSWLGVFISIVIAIEASGVALWFAFRERGVLDTVFGSVVLGLAIALMHYSGMEATRFMSALASVRIPELLFSERYLALAVAITLYTICGFCLMVFSALNYRDDRRRLRS